jgi:hypothetical protein
MKQHRTTTDSADRGRRLPLSQFPLPELGSFGSCGIGIIIVVVITAAGACVFGA